MSHFIHLTSRVINKIHIVEIIKNPSKYLIHMSNSIDGCLVVGGGAVHSKSNIIEICKTKNRQDYDNITHWIKNKKNKFF
jgi:hypothetical protein